MKKIFILTTLLFLISISVVFSNARWEEIASSPLISVQIDKESISLLNSGREGKPNNKIITCLIKNVHAPEGREIFHYRYKENSPEYKIDFSNLSYSLWKIRIDITDNEVMEESVIFYDNKDHEFLRETPDKEWVKIKYPPLTEVRDYSKKVLNIN